MIDTSIIKTLPVENRKKIVDYVEGMPNSLNKFVKLSLLENYMDPEFFNSRNRKMHEYSTVTKYLNKDVIDMVNNPDTCDYQKEYCGLMSIIYDKNSPFDAKIKYALENILNMESYDIDTLIKVEVFIGEFFKELETDRTFVSNPNSISYIANFITVKLMPYKFTVYDFYNYLDINSDMQLEENDYYHMSRLNNMIVDFIVRKPGMTALHDIGSLIYAYMNDLGMASHIDKYNLFSKFKYTMMYYGIPDDDICTVKDRVDELSTVKMNTTLVANTLLNTDRLGNIVKYQSNDLDSDITNPNINDENGYIISFKNIKDYDADVLGELTVNLRALNRNEILHYTNIDSENLTFELNDNDIGHIRNENKINIGTVYDSFSKEMRYLIEKDGEFYIMFKDRMNTRYVYGISINRLPSTEDCDKPRKIVTIKESTNFAYKYITEL